MSAFICEIETGYSGEQGYFATCRRLGVSITDASGPVDAAKRCCRQIERQHGMTLTVLTHQPGDFHTARFESDTTCEPGA